MRDRGPVPRSEKSEVTRQTRFQLPQSVSDPALIIYRTHGKRRGTQDTCLFTMVNASRADGARSEDMSEDRGRPGAVHRAPS
eukprot:3187252-Prymnesium_polylepis.3